MSGSGQVQNGAAFPVCRAAVEKCGFSKPRFGDSRLEGSCGFRACTYVYMNSFWEVPWLVDGGSRGVERFVGKFRRHPSN
jgi:hypothetical protein